MPSHDRGYSGRRRPTAVFASTDRQDPRRECAMSTIGFALVLAIGAAPMHAQGRTECSMQRLTGTWKMASMTFDGKPTNDKELNGAIFRFAGDGLTTETAVGARVEFALTIAESSSPCAFHVTPSAQSGEKGGWMLFAVEGDSLMLGFHDNLDRRPQTFDSRPNMVVARLARQSRQP